MNADTCKALKATELECDIWSDTYRLGIGGGQHIVYEQFSLTDIVDNDTDIKPQEYTIYTQQREPRSVIAPIYLQPFAEVLLQYFKKKYPQIVINNYMIEHRSYIMGIEPFVGNIHNDYCEYTIICYYEIGSGIRGGNLNFYDTDEKLLFTYVPTQGSIKIFSGNHSVTSLYATPESIALEQNHRSILTIFINRHD